MSHRIHTIWAALADDPSACWMLHAEDEYAYEGDPDRCDKAFADAKAECKKNDWLWREVTIVADYEEIAAAFESPEVKGAVSA